MTDLFEYDEDTGSYNQVSPDETKSLNQNVMIDNYEEMNPEQETSRGTENFDGKSEQVGKTKMVKAYDGIDGNAQAANRLFNTGRRAASREKDRRGIRYGSTHQDRESYFC